MGISPHTAGLWSLAAFTFRLVYYYGTWTASGRQVARRTNGYLEELAGQIPRLGLYPSVAAASPWY